MSIVKWEKDETIAVLTMNNGPNLNNPDFFKAMISAFDEIIEDESINGVVIGASDAKSWNTGIDLEWFGNVIANGDMDAMEEFVTTSFNMWEYFALSSFPIVAAITGHAFANGAVMACACDYRLMRKDRGFFCFPEIDVNVPFIPGIIDLAESAIPQPLLQEMIYSGKRYTAEELEKQGVIYKACDNPEETLKEAVAFTKSFQKGRTSFYNNKEMINRKVIKALRDGRDLRLKQLKDQKPAG